MARNTVAPRLIWGGRGPRGDLSRIRTYKHSYLIAPSSGPTFSRVPARCLATTPSGLLIIYSRVKINNV